MKKIKVDSSKLSLNKEKITVLSDVQINNIRGGKEEEAAPGRSTNWDFTCTWCTTIIPAPNDQL